MKAPAIDPKLLFYGAAALALLYVTYRATKAAGNAVDAVTGLPGKALDAVGNVLQSVEDAASSAWKAGADLFSSSSVGVGTTTSPRTLTPTNATFGELSAPGVFGSIDPFDPRYYGLSVQGSNILPATSKQAGPGGGQGTVDSIGNGASFFSSAGNFSGM